MMVDKQYLWRKQHQAKPRWMDDTIVSGLVTAEIRDDRKQASREVGAKMKE